MAEKGWTLKKWQKSKHYMGMDQYLLIPFLVGWTSIYQLFWCSAGVQGFDTLPYRWQKYYYNIHKRIMSSPWLVGATVCWKPRQPSIFQKVPVPIRDSQSHGKSHVYDHIPISLAVEESWSNGGGKMVHVDLDVPPKSWIWPQFGILRTKKSLQVILMLDFPWKQKQQTYKTYATYARSSNNIWMIFDNSLEIGSNI